MVTQALVPSRRGKIAPENLGNFMNAVLELVGSHVGVFVQPVAAAPTLHGFGYVLAVMLRHKAEARCRDSNEALWFSDGT